jgi:hypothetical protein
MCYSAQVSQLVRKLNRQLGLQIDYVESERLFFRRLEDPSIVISRGFEANFDDPQNDHEKRIKNAIDEHRSCQATKWEQELFAQKTRRSNAERSLKEKETKKSREDVRIATNKIETLARKLSDLRRGLGGGQGDHSPLRSVTVVRQLLRNVRHRYKSNA